MCNILDKYRIYLCIMCTFFSQILPLKSRCALYLEPFVFIWGNLHNNTKNTTWNDSQFYEARRNKSRQKVFQALYITSLFSPHPSLSIRVSHVYDHDWKSFVFSRVFRWQNNFHEEFSFRLCKSLFHPFLFWFFAQNAKRFEREKIVEIFSAILDLITWPTTLVCSRSPCS